MQLQFKYDLQKDTDNFLKSAHAINSKKPTKLQRLYTEKYGTDPDATHAADFIVEYQIAQGIDVPARVAGMEEDWRAIEKEVLGRMEKMFGITYPGDKITVYLSTNSRCTYRIEDDYFFVHMESAHPNGIIAHELLHFYTWYAYHDELEKRGVSKEQYNDIKESLTEILNIDFADLLGGYVDAGYPQHAELRAQVRESRMKGESLSNLLKTLA